MDSHVVFSECSSLTGSSDWFSADGDSNCGGGLRDLSESTGVVDDLHSCACSFSSVECCSLSKHSPTSSLRLFLSGSKEVGSHCNFVDLPVSVPEPDNSSCTGFRILISFVVLTMILIWVAYIALVVLHQFGVLGCTNLYAVILAAGGALVVVTTVIGVALVADIKLLMSIRKHNKGGFSKKIRELEDENEILRRKLDDTERMFASVVEAQGKLVNSSLSLCSEVSSLRAENARLMAGSQNASN